MSEQGMETSLAVNKAIEGLLDNLIRAAAKQVPKANGAADQRSKTQIRNLVNVAEHTQSLEVVTNFIRYQIGRNTALWQQNSFGMGIIGDIERKDGIVQTSLKLVEAQVPGADLKAARARIIMLYTGYLNRIYVYAAATGDWDNLCSRLDAPGGAT